MLNMRDQAAQQPGYPFGISDAAALVMGMPDSPDVSGMMVPPVEGGYPMASPSPVEDSGINPLLEEIARMYLKGVQQASGLTPVA